MTITNTELHNISNFIQRNFIGDFNITFAKSLDDFLIIVSLPDGMDKKVFTLREIMS